MGPGAWTVVPFDYSQKKNNPSRLRFDGNRSLAHKLFDSQSLLSPFTSPTSDAAVSGR